VTLAASLRAWRDRKRTSERASAYAIDADSACFSEQLALLNRAWDETIAAVPFWSARVASGDVPRRFESLEEFAARVPATDRALLQRERARLVHGARAPEVMRITGGSTAEPVQIPSWRSEFEFTHLDVWMARAWYGLAPEARQFLLWGHSHLLGSGWRGWINARKREISDRVLGYYRASAYDLAPDAMRRAANALIRFRPALVLGYSVALDRFAAANAGRREALRAAGVRLVLAAAEGFPSADSAAALADLFGCPVGMEYGAVETGLVAHTHPTGGYRVFWRSYLIEAERVGAHHRVRVTSLYPRCTPLVRYELGDEIALPAEAADRVASVLRFERVVGRCNDYVVLEDGFTAHSEVFTHAVRMCSAVRAYQIVQAEGRLALLYTAEADLPAAEARAIRERLARVHPGLGAIGVERVAALHRTIAGKTPMVLRR
jgi:phenylacetate-coenzyme A ligase PaaK-like adenylate-forming protein